MMGVHRLSLFIFVMVYIYFCMCMGFPSKGILDSLLHYFVADKVLSNNYIYTYICALPPNLRSLTYNYKFLYKDEFSLVIILSVLKSRNFY